MLHLPVGNLVDPAVGAIVAFGVGVMARVHVVPIIDINLPIWTVSEVEHLRRQITRQKKVFPMMADEARALAFQNVLVRSLAMDVVHEDCVPILVGPRSALVDHRAGMRMPATRIARAAIAG